MLLQRAFNEAQSRQECRVPDDVWTPFAGLRYVMIAVDCKYAVSSRNTGHQRSFSDGSVPLAATRACVLYQSSSCEGAMQANMQFKAAVHVHAADTPQSPQRRPGVYTNAPEE